MSTPEYQGGHQPSGPDFGAPLHDVTRGIYPKDFYDKPHEYVSLGGETGAHQSLSVVQFAKGRPNKLVRIYRAVPKDAPRGGINPGDWVTTSSLYAREHGRSNLNNSFKIRQRFVRAKDLYTSGDSINEWGYHPGE